MNIFLNKKILIYGLGKSGLSAFKFLKDKCDVTLYDDYPSKIKLSNIKKHIINYKNIWIFIHYLNFKVAKPIIAKIIEIIQNLITTVDSGQPFFSK